MRNNKKVLLLIGLLVFALFASSLAFFFDSLNLENLFATDSYGGTLIEKFTPEFDWEPGMTVTKEVTVKNTGEYNLYVRVKMNESWDNGVSWSSSDEEFFMSTKAIAIQGNATDGFTTGDETVVYKDLNLTDWTYNSQDGYFYYNSILAPGETSTPLMNYVTLADNTDMGLYTTENYYQIVLVGSGIVESNWVNEILTPMPAIEEGQELYRKSVLVLDPNAQGYSEAEYTLTVTTELSQVSVDAAVANGWDIAFLPGQ